jgi:disulfide oxidoreductase YuzD
MQGKQRKFVFCLIKSTKNFINNYNVKSINLNLIKLSQASDQRKNFQKIKQIKKNKFFYCLLLIFDEKLFKFLFKRPDNVRDNFVL